MAAKILRLIKIYVQLQMLHLRVFMEYEADFWIGIVAVAIKHGVGFIFVWTLFTRIPLINGWTMWEVSFLYALSIIPLGLVELLCDGQWQLRYLVNRGGFDRILLRPVSPILQVITQEQGIHGIGSVLLGSIVLFQSYQKLHLEWSWGTWLFLVLTILGAILLIGSINLLTNSIVFWESSSDASLPLLMYNVSEFGKFPADLYSKTVQFIVTWMLPFAFVSYYPGLLLLDKSPHNLYTSYLAPLAGPIMALIASLVWHQCLTHYQGTGN